MYFRSLLPDSVLFRLSVGSDDQPCLWPLLGDFWVMSIERSGFLDGIVESILDDYELGVVGPWS